MFTFNPKITYVVAHRVLVEGRFYPAGDPIPKHWPPSLIERLLRRRVIRPGPTIVAPAEDRVECREVVNVVGRDLDVVNVSVVVLSCYPDIFSPLRDQFNNWEPAAHKILVTSGSSGFTSTGWQHISGIEPFCFARNSNLGIKACGTDDVFLVNDDVRLCGPILARLQEVAYFREDVGILAPQIIGGVGNLTQRVATHIDGDMAFPAQRLAFVAVYIKRSTFDKIGLLDERFRGYGSEDSDFVYRVRQAGMKSAVTPHVVVKHGVDGHANSSSSFLRQMNRKDQIKSMLEMRRLLSNKWGGRCV